jgi:hypothetical protein
MKYIRLIILISIIAINNFFGYSQVTKIMGKVTDSLTKEAIPFVNLVLKGTAIGTTTNFEGEFTLETKVKSDTLVFSCIGYKVKKIPIIKNHFQKINIQLEPTVTKLTEVVVRYSGNPADKILKKIIEKKDNNNSFDYDYIEYEVYNKIQFDVNNIDEKFKKSRAFKKFNFIFNYVDTSTVNGKVYLPVFLSETISKVYSRKSPNAKKEYIRGIKLSGIENESISQFMNDLYLNINVYNNYIPLFDKNFVSPIASFGGAFYHYYLVDSTFIDSKWCYNIAFKPRRTQDLTFSGNFWVADTSWAIKIIKMDVAKEANLNFINGIAVEQSFNTTDSNKWVITNDKVVVDFNAFDNAKSTTGFYGRKSTSYQSHIINKPNLDKVYDNPLDVITEDSAFLKSEVFWQASRHDSLSRDEKTIYYMIDTLKSLPIIKTYIDIAKTLILGYKIYKNIEIGPYMSFLSFNQTEGTRIRIGGRTSNDFSTKILLNAHVAYGIKDTKLKYGASYIYLFSKTPRIGIGGGIMHDLEQLGQSDNAFREDFLLASVFRRSDANKLTMVDQYDSFYEQEWLTGFSTRLTFMFRDLYPLDNSKFLLYENQEQREVKNLTTSEIQLKLRYAHKERYLVNVFERTNLGTLYPVFTLQYSYGVPSLFGSNFEYHKLNVSIDHWFKIGTFGWSEYLLYGGKVFSKLPYPLLKLHEGNETWFFDPMAFNTMKYYEFVSDQYLSLSYSHHFDGLFFNKIPLFRKLKWREVGYFKGLIGSLETRNKNYSKFPLGLSELSSPYYEAGFGIENIFKFIRIDAVWRLSHLNKSSSSNYGIYGSFMFSF